MKESFSFGDCASVPNELSMSDRMRSLTVGFLLFLEKKRKRNSSTKLGFFELTSNTGSWTATCTQEEEKKMRSGDDEWMESMKACEPCLWVRAPAPRMMKR